MTPLKKALELAEVDGAVFPCREQPPKPKQPRTPHGFHDATRDPDIITRWWRQWPNALIGMPTGHITRRWVLDIDVKEDLANGFDSLEELGIVLPSTRMVHTTSGGLHVYFDTGGRELRNSAGLIGPGLDVRGDGGYVIVPSSGSGYEWDPIYGPDMPLAPAPEWLWPVKPSRLPMADPLRPVIGLNRYGEAAIEAACDAIARAGPGQQERTLNSESFSLGALAGAGAIPADIALGALLRAAAAMPDHDPRWPWRQEEIDYKVRRAFADGTRHPREARRARVA